MPGDGFRIALVQAQQVPPDRGIEITGLDLVGQIGLVRPRRPSIGPTTPALTATTPGSAGLATAGESRTAALGRTATLPARPVASTVAPVGCTTSAETTLIGFPLEPTASTETTLIAPASGPAASAGPTFVVPAIGPAAAEAPIIGTASGPLRGTASEAAVVRTTSAVRTPGVTVVPAAIGIAGGRTPL